jgi:uncharacterized protein YndB with AHSA1/START domain
MPNYDAAPTRNLSLQLNRLIPASTERVFEAWTNPELLKQWFVAGRLMAPAAAAREDDAQSLSAGVAGIGGRDPREQSQVTVRLFEAISGTTLTVDHEGFQTDESLEAHHMAWDSSLTKLRELFSRP